jgi:tetratricopeptide (TPR) repeat protein
MGSVHPSKQRLPGRIGTWALAVWLLASSLAFGAAPPGESPWLHPLTPQEQRRRQALKWYAIGLQCAREDRLLEARQALEQAARLDPQAPPIFKELMMVCLALDQEAAALAASRQVLALDPEDVETWLLQARLLRAQGHPTQALTSLRKGLATAAARRRPEVRQQMYNDLGEVSEALQDYVAAAQAWQEAARLLKEQDALREGAATSPEEVQQRAAAAYERAGQDWLRARRPAEALAAFRQAQEAYPAGAARLGYHLARVYAAQGQNGAALEALEPYLQLQPQDPSPYELKIALLRRLGRAEQILPWLEQATAADKHNISLKLLFARTCREEGRPAQAEQVYLAIAEHVPSAEVYRGLFSLYLEGPRAGRARALQLLDRTLKQAARQGKEGETSLPALQAQAMLAALRSDGRLADALLQAALQQEDGPQPLQQQTRYLLAVLAERQHQLEQAERFYRQALLRVPPEQEALVYDGLLRVLWKAHKYEEIVQVCQEGLKKALATRPALFHLDRARALARLGKATEALAAADEAVRLAVTPDDSRLLRRLRLRILIELERLPQAEAEGQALLREARTPAETIEARYLLSHVYTAAGNYSQAEEQLQWILKADASNATACNDLGYLWAEQGKNLTQAEQLIRKALELERQQRRQLGIALSDSEQDNAAYVDSLGWVLFRQGRLTEARRQLERAVTLPDGEDPVIWDHLGDVYFRLQLPEQARAAWRQAQRLYEQDRRLRDRHYQDLLRKLRLLEHQTPGTTP